MFKQFRSFISLARRVAEAGEKPLGTQLMDIFSARFSEPARLGVSEYYDLCLYQRSIDRDRVRKFGGYRLIQRVRSGINNSAWVCFNRDKLVFNLYAQSLGLPIADTRLAVTASTRSTGSIRNVTTYVEVREFLRQSPEYPLFIKPVFGSYGKGALALDALDADSGLIFLGPSGERRIEEIVTHIMTMSRSHAARGCILQKQLSQHPDITALAGRRVSGLRIGMVRYRGAPVLYRAAMKIHAGGSITDNFEHGRAGNLLADVDISNGALTRVIRGVGPMMREVTHHPVSGMSFVDFQVPEWKRVREICVEMASSLPELNVIGFDVAISATGPILLEANTPGDFDLLQQAARKGVLEEPAFRALFGELNF